MLDFLVNPFIFSSFNPGVSLVSSIYGIAIFFIYLIACYMSFGITKSISITYYKHSSAKYNFLFSHNLRWLFQAFMYASAASIFFIAQNGWYFIVACLFTLMAFFPSVLYRGHAIPHIVYHCIFASLAIALMIIGLPVCYGIKYILFCVIAAVADLLIAIFCKQRPSDWDGKEKVTTKLYWIEVVSILTLMVGLIGANVKLF